MSFRNYKVYPIFYGEIKGKIMLIQISIHGIWLVSRTPKSNNFLHKWKETSTS